MALLQKKTFVLTPFGSRQGISSRETAAVPHSVIFAEGDVSLPPFLPRRYINGVVSNGVVSKKPDLQMVAKPAPETFRIQGTYHN